MDRFAIGGDLVGLDDGEPAVLADHTWIWTDDGAVAVPVSGRSVHGVLHSALAVAPGERTSVVAASMATVTVVTSNGASRNALALVRPADAVDPRPMPGAELADLTGAARRLGLPLDWVTHLGRWGQRPRRSPGAEPTSLTSLLATPGVREECDLRSRFGFMAIHGGDLESATDTIARLAAERSGASYYGVIHPDGFDGHLASIRFDPAESSMLASFLVHVDVVVSVHGYGRTGRWRSLLLGGRNRALAADIARELAHRLPDHELVTDLDEIPSELRGLDERNPVNRPGGCGVQLELPPRIRGLSPLSPPPGPDGLAPTTASLVEGLATVARQWPDRPAAQ
jgi:phage replication-related protein YjqB (UPF0714/DUF867 family)